MNTKAWSASLLLLTGVLGSLAACSSTDEGTTPTPHADAGHDAQAAHDSGSTVPTPDASTTPHADAGKDAATHDAATADAAALDAATHDAALDASKDAPANG